MASEKLGWFKKSVNENQLAYGAVAFVASGIAGYRFIKYLHRKKQNEKIKKFEEQSIAEDKLILHMSPRWDFSTPHPSPYVTKMMAYLAYNKIDYLLDTSMSQHF